MSASAHPSSPSSRRLPRPVDGETGVHGAGASNSDPRRPPSTAAKIGPTPRGFTSQVHQTPVVETAPPLPIAGALCPAEPPPRKPVGARAWSGGHGGGEGQIGRPLRHPQVPGTARQQYQRPLRSSLISRCCSCSYCPRTWFRRTSWLPVGKPTSTLSRPMPREGLLLSGFICSCRIICVFVRIRAGTV